MPSFKCAVQQPLGFVAALALSTLLLSACQGDIVHQRPMAELNQKAQALMAAGDYAGAIARLESAHDLNPNEPNTAYNLALAYQAGEKPLKAIPLIADLIDRHPAGGPSVGELNKTMGILWEARGDELHKTAQAIAAKEPKSAKPSEARPNEREVEADRAYASAIDYYHKALQSKDLKDAASVQEQVSALESRRKAKPVFPFIGTGQQPEAQEQQEQPEQ